MSIVDPSRTAIFSVLRRAYARLGSVRMPSRVIALFPQSANGRTGFTLHLLDISAGEERRMRKVGESEAETLDDVRAAIVHLALPVHWDDPVLLNETIVQNRCRWTLVDPYVLTPRTICGTVFSEEYSRTLT